jgi:hypothetical protein
MRLAKADPTLAKNFDIPFSLLPACKQQSRLHLNGPLWVTSVWASHPYDQLQQQG